MISQLRSVHALVLAVTRRLSWLAPLAARLGVGLVFVSTGWGKLQNIDRVIEFFRSLGIPAPELQAPFVAGTEFVCGALILAGFAARFAAIPLMITMLVAIRTALWPELEGVVDLAGREEFLLFLLLGWIAVAGAGPVSLDAGFVRWLHTRAPRQRLSAAGSAAARGASGA